MVELIPVGVAGFGLSQRTWRRRCAALSAAGRRVPYTARVWYNGARYNNDCYAKKGAVVMPSAQTATALVAYSA